MIAGHRCCANGDHHDRSHSDSEDDCGSEERGGGGEAAAATTTVIGPGSDECTVEQRVALLNCLRAVANNNKQFKILMDPEFLQQRFRDLLVEDKSKTTIIRFAAFYSCNKILPECHALARNHGVAEMERQVGKLEVYVNDDHGSDDGYESEGGDEGDCPFEVVDVSADGAQHFVLSRNQWKQLRCEEGCIGCPLYMSVFTYYNRDSVDVNSILNGIYIL